MPLPIPVRTTGTPQAPLYRGLKWACGTKQTNKQTSLKLNHLALGPGVDTHNSQVTSSDFAEVSSTNDPGLSAAEPRQDSVLRTSSQESSPVSLAFLTYCETSRQVLTNVLSLSPISHPGLTAEVKYTELGSSVNILRILTALLTRSLQS